MTINASSSCQRYELPERTLRFIAIFGIVYGLLESIQFLDQCRRWQFWLRVVTDGYVFERGHLVGGFIVDASSIWLILASIAFLWKKPRAQMSLFVWAVFALGIEVARDASSILRSIPNLMEDLRWIVDMMIRWSIEWVGYPAMLICALSLYTVAGISGRGFSVLHHTPDTFGTMQSASSLPTHQFAHGMLRWIARFGVLLGLLGLTQTIIQISFLSFPYYNRVPPNYPRFPVMKLVLMTKQLSFALLLAGGVAVRMRRRIGRKLLLNWAAIFLAMGVMQFALYDCM